jgi:hypothetical protein
MNRLLNTELKSDSRRACRCRGPLSLLVYAAAEIKWLNSPALFRRSSGWRASVNHRGIDGNMMSVSKHQYIISASGHSANQPSSNISTNFMSRVA